MRHDLLRKRQSGRGGGGDTSRQSSAQAQSRAHCRPVVMATASASAALLLHGALTAYSLISDLSYLFLVLNIVRGVPGLYEEVVCCGGEYITIWNQVLQQVYVFSSLWVDIVKAFPERFAYSRKAASAVRNFLFPTCVIPINTIVLVLFWSLYILAPHMIEDRGIMERYLESWMNHCLHTNIIIISLMEIIICAPKFPSRRRAFVTVVGMVLLYSITASGCRMLGGPWAYPIIKIMFSNWITFIMFQAFCIIIGYTGYIVAEYINNLVHGDQKKITSMSNGHHQNCIKTHVQ